MTPEQKARQKIDQQLEQCGWIVQNQDEMNISAGHGVAIREFTLKNGFADYMLYADCRAIGVVEARRQGALLLIAKKLMECLQVNIVMPTWQNKTKNTKRKAPVT